MLQAIVSSVIVLSVIVQIELQVLKLTVFFCAWKYYRPNLTNLLWCDNGSFHRLLFTTVLRLTFDPSISVATRKTKDIILLNKLDVD